MMRTKKEAQTPNAALIAWTAFLDDVQSGASFTVLNQISINGGIKLS
ncbi:MAG: hypothetical protein QNJ54_26745 [Prochloraceae cyanobacterium]|nr:hypothetical protein [Prochloraceae cyanobacterium]